MLKGFLAASAIALILASSPAAATLGNGLAVDTGAQLSVSAPDLQKIDFVPGRAAAPLNLAPAGHVKSVMELAETARYDGFNTLVTLLTLLSAAGVFVGASLATARKEDDRAARMARRQEDREAEAGWKGDVMRALEAELMNIDRVATRRAA